MWLWGIKKCKHTYKCSTYTFTHLHMDRFMPTFELKHTVNSAAVFIYFLQETLFCSTNRVVSSAHAQSALCVWSALTVFGFLVLRCVSWSQSSLGSDWCQLRMFPHTGFISVQQKYTSEVNHTHCGALLNTRSTKPSKQSRCRII